MNASRSLLRVLGPPQFEPKLTQARFGGSKYVLKTLLIPLHFEKAPQDRSRSLLETRFTPCAQAEIFYFHRVVQNPLLLLEHPRDALFPS